MRPPATLVEPAGLGESLMAGEHDPAVEEWELAMQPVPSEGQE